jgi:hypothetical protein
MYSTEKLHERMIVNAESITVKDRRLTIMFSVPNKRSPETGWIADERHDSLVDFM